MQKEFNNIYQKLVSDKNDIVGHIAYSLYKQDKINFIKDKEENEITITDAELIPFHELSSTDSSIESYTIKAELILQAFFESTFEEMATDMEQQAIANQAQILKDIIAPIKPNFWKRVWSGLVTALIFALLLALIAFILQNKDSVIKIQVQQPTIQQPPE